MRNIFRYFFPLLILCTLIGCTDPVDPITLNHSKIEIETGKETTLKASLLPEDFTTKITWSSNNETSAKVDQNGKVSAITAGRAIVTAKTTEGATANCEVTVKAKPGITISLEKTSLTIEPENSETLKATVKPEGTVTKITWTSSDDSHAKVDGNGKVTAVSSGEATITAKTTEGATATCKVTVKNNELKVDLSKGITLQSIIDSSENKNVSKLTITGPLENEDWATLRSLENLKSMDLSACTNTVIPENAFSGMKSENFKIILPKGLTDIDNGAFKKCSIAEIDIPENTDYIEQDAFEDATIKHLRFSTDKVYMETCVFKNATIEKVTFREGLVSTPGGMFSQDDGEHVTINEIKFPDSLTTIGSTSFKNATLPEDFTLPETIKKIEKMAFKGTGLSYYDVKPAEDAEIVYTAFDHKYSIDLDTKSIKLEEGKTQALNAIITLIDTNATQPKGEPKIYWYSSSKSVAVVDENGIIKAKKVGTAKITARTGEGGKAECNVTVTKAK